MDSTSILINIRKILRSVNLESKRIQKAYGISIPQLLILNFLNQQEDCKATHKQISKYLNLNSSTITGITARLLTKGWVAKVQDAKDKRVSYVTLTASGLKLLAATPQLMHEQLAKKLEATPPDKVQELERAFDLLIEFMGIQDIDASPVITVEEFN